MADWDFSVSARKVEHITRKRDAGCASLQGTHKFNSLLDRDAKVVRASREIELVEIVRNDSDVRETFEKIPERIRIVIHSTKQNTLVSDDDPRINELRDGLDILGGDFSRMVEVRDHEDRVRRVLVTSKRGDESDCDA